MLKYQALYDTYLAGRDQGFEQVMGEVQGMCSWVSGSELHSLRLVVAALAALVGADDANLFVQFPEDVDVSMLEEPLVTLASRADAAGDARLSWFFGQFYDMVCAWMDGSRYYLTDFSSDGEAVS